MAKRETRMNDAFYVAYSDRTAPHKADRPTVLIYGPLGYKAIYFFHQPNGFFQSNDHFLVV